MNGSTKSTFQWKQTDWVASAVNPACRQVRRLLIVGCRARNERFPSMSCNFPLSTCSVFGLHLVPSRPGVTGWIRRASATMLSLTCGRVYGLHSSQSPASSGFDFMLSNATSWRPCATHHMLTRDPHISLTLAATPLFWPFITEAPSHPNPTDLVFRSSETLGPVTMASRMFWLLLQCRHDFHVVQTHV